MSQLNSTVRFPNNGLSYPSRVKVELRVDLTRYHASLKPGTVGETRIPCGVWAKVSDRFCGVAFPEVSLDVLMSDLKIVDQEYLEIERAERRAREAGLRDARSTFVKHVGARGAFKSATITYAVDGQNVLYTTADVDECEQLEKIFKETGRESEIRLKGGAR